MTKNLPSGTVTFLFTDIEGSTRLAQNFPGEWPALFARHHQILHEAIQANRGYVFQVAGDSFAAAFHSASDALNAALEAQRNLAREPWAPVSINVRMGIHTGAAELQFDSKDDTYSGYATKALAQRIMSAGHGGQVLVSGATRELVRHTLPTGNELLYLGEKRLKDIYHSEHLYQLNAADLPTNFPPLKTLDLHPNNLPAQLTSFIGREKEVSDLKQELDRHRLVTLTGSGGTGKTRLSLEVAGELLGRFEHGVWFIELAALVDPDLVPQAILSAIGLQEQPGRTKIDVLKEYMHERTLLLVVDNCEHLVSACARVAYTLLNAAPKLKILASSREALGIQGELIYPVPSLSMPDPRHLPAIDDLFHYEAVQLFIDRARDTVPHFVLDQDNAAYIAQICYRLDGIPLAIELAAARVKMLSVEQISRRLNDRFRLLTGGARTALPRQQTLRALIDWSYDLLPDEERRLLRRLSVFEGSWTLEAAEVVCSGGGIEPFEVLDLSAQLANRSLIIVMDPARNGIKRYRMLETIRQYAREKLLESGEGEQLHDNHFEYFRQMVHQARSEYFSPKELVWLVWLENEWGNLRAAVEWSSEKTPDLALELVNNLGELFLVNANNAREMDNWLAELLADARNSGRTARRACGLIHWALFANYNRDSSVSSMEMIEEGLSIYAELGDKTGLAHGYLTKGWYEKAVDLYRETQNKVGLALTLHYYGVFQPQGEVERKLAYLEESLAIRRELGYTTGIIESLKQIGAIRIRVGDFESAHQVLQEGFSILRAHVSVLGNSITMAYDLGDLAFYEGDYDLAQKHFEDALAWAIQKGQPVSIVWAKVRLGYLYLQKCELEKAELYFHQALASFLKNTNEYGAVVVLEGFAGLATARQEWEKAARLFASLNRQREKMQFRRPPVEQAFIDRQLAMIQSHLDGRSYEMAWNEGAGLALEAAIALVGGDAEAGG